MRRVILLLTMMAATLVVASGVALAVNKMGTNGPDTLKGTNGADKLLGNGGNDTLFALAGNDNLLGGAGKDEVLGGDERKPKRGARRTWWVVPITTWFIPVSALTKPWAEPATIS